MACRPPAKNPPVKAPAIAPATGPEDMLSEDAAFFECKSFVVGRNCTLFCCLDDCDGTVRVREFRDGEVVKAAADANKRSSNVDEIRQFIMT